MQEQDFCQNLWPVGEPSRSGVILKSCLILKGWITWRRIHTGAIPENLQILGRGHWRSLGKAVSLGRDLIVEQGHGRGISVLNWLQSPLPIPSVLPGERRQKTQEWRAQEYVAKWAEVFFYFCSYFSLSYSGVNWQKLKWIFSRMSLVYTSTVTALYLTHELSHFIFSPCSAREG